MTRLYVVYLIFFFCFSVSEDNCSKVQRSLSSNKTISKKKKNTKASKVTALTTPSTSNSDLGIVEIGICVNSFFFFIFFFLKYFFFFFFFEYYHQCHQVVDYYSNHSVIFSTKKKKLNDPPISDLGQPIAHK
jgi:hypothetical protein